MRTYALAIILFASLAFAENRDFSVSSSANDAVTSGFAVKVSYSIPESNELLKGAKSDPLMAPGKVIWLWGDEEPGAKTKNFTEANYDTAVKAQSASHTYKKPGKYSVTVIINDVKNRNIIQAGITVQLSQPVQIYEEKP